MNVPFTADYARYWVGLGGHRVPRDVVLNNPASNEVEPTFPALEAGAFTNVRHPHYHRMHFTLTISSRITVSIPGFLFEKSFLSRMYSTRELYGTFLLLDYANLHTQHIENLFQLT